VSHFVAVKTQYKDVGILLEVLRGLFERVELNMDGVALRGYQGDDRSLLPTTDANYAPRCHVVIRKADVGAGANDIGFRQESDGTFTAYVSDYDKQARADKLSGVPQKYARLVAKKQARLSGYVVKEETAEDGSVVLTLSKWRTQ